MAYIGKQPAIGNFVKLDAISVVNGQASYTMQNGGANFTEYSNVNQFLVSLNGILQSPTDSFTVASSTITFASNLQTGDVIDFIIVLGNSLDVGVPSDNTVSTAKIVDGAITSGKLASGVGGKVLQVVSTTKTDTFTMSSTTFADVTNLSASITPISTSSKILILYSLMGHSNANNASFTMRLLRDSTAISIGDSAGSRIQGTTIRMSGFNSNNGSGTQAGSFLDSPNTTSALSYKIQVRTDGAGNPMFVNRGETDTDSSGFSRGVSTITVMEIAG